MVEGKGRSGGARKTVGCAVRPKVNVQSREKGRWSVMHSKEGGRRDYRHVALQRDCIAKDLKL